MGRRQDVRLQWVVAIAGRRAWFSVLRDCRQQLMMSRCAQRLTLRGRLVPELDFTSADGRIRIANGWAEPVDEGPEGTCMS